MIDPYSESFIKWANETLSNPREFAKYKQWAMDGMNDFFNSPDPELRQAILQKLHRGAREHGEPFHEIEWLQEELKSEFYDIIGYLLLITWNLKNGK